MTRCQRCHLKQVVCICDCLPSIATRTRVVIVRHMAERAKPSNTGRLAALCLDNAEIRDYGAPDAPTLADLGRRGDALLFPEGRAHAGPPPARLIVLDGTWPQARRMRQRIDALRGLPLVTVGAVGAPAPARDVQRLRRPPVPGYLSTIEAIAAALERLEGDGAAAPLRAVYHEYVRRSRSTGRSPPRRHTDD